MNSEPLNGQSAPIIEDKPNHAANKRSKPSSNAPLDWWDLLHLVEEPVNSPAIHWTPQGIITAHPTKPLLLLYPHPPGTTERKVFPSDRRISESDAFLPARIVSASESGDHVFSYFPLANSSNSGAWCIWVNMVLRQFWTVEQGEAIIACWWLGNPRHRVVDHAGRPVRLPQLGPRIAFHSPAALLLSENFTLHLVCEPSMNPQQDSPLLVTTANALRATVNASPRASAGLDPYTGFVCTRAAMGLSYSDSSIVIAMQAALLPPPCLPLSDAQSMGLSVSSATFLPHSNVDEWEYSGVEPTLRLCEVAVTYTNRRGWDMQTKPIISIPTPLSSSLAHLHFIPKSPEGDTTMVVDSSCPSRYLVIGLVRFEAQFSSPESSLLVYSLQKDTTNWKIQQEAAHPLAGRAALTLAIAQPSYGRQTGIVVSLANLSTPSNLEPQEPLVILQIPSLKKDDSYRNINLQILSAPSVFAIAPSGAHIVLQSLRNPKEFGFHPFPSRKDVVETDRQRDALVNTLLSSQDSQNVYKQVIKSSRETKLDLLDSTCATLDSENGGGDTARWSIQYLQELMLIETAATNETEQSRTKQAITLDYLSLPAAKGALIECHNKEADGPYDPECIWPLSDICGWVMEFSEGVISAAGEHAHAIKKVAPNTPNQSIDPRLLILLHQSFLCAWIDTLTLVSQFLQHIDGPKGSNNDNKTLVTKSFEAIVEQSPLNITSLLNALKTLTTGQFPTAAEWRKAYRTGEISGPFVQSMASTVELLVVPDIVALLPLHVKMAGLNLLQNEEAHQERDIITKKPLIQSELQSLGYGIRASCLRCHGKTTIDFSAPLDTSRWKRWELSFLRCICGGRWKPSA